ncbi:stabilizer of axonemal microtubules 4 isoform 2-T2 [Alca torda]
MRGKFWGHSITATLASQRSHCQDTARSTAAEHFQPLMLPDGRSLLPRHVHQPGSGYLQASSLSCLRTEAVSPQHPPLLQGRPSAPGEHSTGSRRTGPAQPDVLQKTTIGTKEQSGFTRATPRSDSVLPALPGQPGLPAVGHPIPLVSRGLQAPRVTQASLLGQQVVGRMVGAAVALSLSPSLSPSPFGPRTQPTSIPQEPSGFTTNHNQYVPPVSPAAPAQCWRGPTWTARPMGGIQPQRPSGFSTNNHPTGLGDIVGQPPLPVAPTSLGTPPTLNPLERMEK